MSGLLRLYQPDELGRDGYPPEWHRCPRCAGSGWLCDECDGPADNGCRRCENPLASAHGCPDCFVEGSCGGAGSIKAIIRAAAGWRCVRCLHPYVGGEHGSGEWSPCDRRCIHFDGKPVRYVMADGSIVQKARDEDVLDVRYRLGEKPPTLIRIPPKPWTDESVEEQLGEIGRIEAQWRILTVHHLDINKANCCWWNLAALCQRCHLQIQGKVQMARVWPWEHSEWFRPYVAGYYAHAYLGEDLDRPAVEARLDELLALERVA